MEKLIELVVSILSTGVVGALVLYIFAKLDWGGWFSKMLDKRIQESLAKNQASLDNRLYRTKLLFDIEIEVLREVCKLMHEMVDITFRIQYINPKIYLQLNKQTDDKLIKELIGAKNSLYDLRKYKDTNSAFIEKEINNNLGALIIKCQKIIDTIQKLTYECIQNEFINLDDLNDRFEIYTIPENHNYSYYSYYAENTRLKLIKLPENSGSKKLISEDCEDIIEQIRDYISRLKIID